MSVGFNAPGARFFEGDRPTPVEISLHIASDSLQIGLDESRILHWPLEDIRRLPDMAGKRGAVLRLASDPLARLYIEDLSMLARLPHPNRTSPPKGRARLMAWALAAIAAVALQIGFLVPLLADNLAGFIPARGERALGETTLGHIREALSETGLNPLEVCDGTEGAAALAQLTERLAAERGFNQDLTVSVLDHEMINAFALPGGFVVLFRGLIEAADDPDQVAAVLAHEIGHVISRDPTRHALRSAGSIGVLGLLLGDFAGGAAVLFLTERLISAQYSQAAETGADRFAHALLKEAQITPAALGAMFDRLRKKHGDAAGVTAHFLTHPRLSDRIDLARAAVDPAALYRPSMLPGDWAALRDICN
ncbi:MAG: M48 family metallopeptidase [Sulfitobacter sp.]|nr:M48 family metallopeptidase [Sulfitobacter sp.]